MCAHETTPLADQATAQVILLVEDETLIAMSEKAMLQKHGFTVLTAANGAMAVDLALRTPQLDLILMDINLGSGMDGAEAAQQILAQRDVPIVFLFSHTEQEVVEKTEKITSYGYVVKNSGEMVLLASIKMAFKLFDAYQRLKQQEAALRKTKQELQIIFDTVPALIWQKDRAGTYVQVNRAYCDTIRLSEEAILGKTDEELFPPEIADQYVSTDRKVLNSGVPEFGIEQHYQKLSGEYGWNRTDKLPYYDSAGHLTGTIGFALDITDRKQVEEALRESRERLIAAQRIAKLGDIIWNIETGEVSWSDALYDLMQYDRSEKIDFARVNTEIHHPEDLERVTRWLRDSIASGSDKLAPNEYRIIRRDGKMLFVRVQGVIKRREGEQTRVFVTLQDITERKQAEEALRESEERFNLFMQHLPGLAFIKDIEGRIIFVNAYHANLYPLEPQEMIGQNFKNFWNPEINARFAEQDRMILASRQPLTTEELYPDREGLKYWLTCKFPIFQQDKPTLIGGISLDITARKRAEEALQKSEQQLRALNAQKDKFFSILAHDLRNPLISFVFFANLLENDFDSRAPAERNMLIQQFRTSVELLSALLENLLTWARLQQGRFEYIPVQFSLDQLVARAVALLTPTAVQKQITLINTTPPVKVYASIEMAETIVRNLLVNAIKFTPSGGEVTITAAQTAHDVQVTVTDTGIGIPPDKIAQLFRIDGKVQREGTNGEKGTGLGLILCKEFVEKQGGKIWVESKPGNSTRVMFTLPAQPVEREDP